MATPMIRWLLSILLASLQPTVAAEGPPAPPSRPVCFLPCNENDCLVDIRCTWDHSPDTEIPITYSLHWRSLNSVEKTVTSGLQLNAVILREHAPRHEELFVWVQARNQFGFVKSETLNITNVDDIIKPPPPNLSSSHHEPLEIQWSSACGGLHFFIGSCEARHQTEEDQTWLEPESGLLGSYTLIESKPGTIYRFQVRCSCNTGLMSDWSESLQMKSGESPPVGKVNVWRDCLIFPTNSDCYLTWKDLPGSQARGAILGHEVRISYSNGRVARINESTAGPGSQFVHDGGKWYLTSPLKDVSSVSVSAHNALGSTLPSYLEMPLKGKEENDGTIHLDMNAENLTVSWDLPSQFLANLKEYVVQYKEAGRPGGQGFDWIRVDKSQKKVRFTGPFINYTAYQVSLFRITHGGVHHVQSVIGYSLEKVPPEVPSFEVFSIEETEVLLVWEPLPLTKQNGRLLNYQIGLNAEEVHNQTLQSAEFKLRDLQPGREYEVWIRAVNAAGPGPTVTRRFNTKHSKGFVFLRMIGILSAVLCACLVGKFAHYLMARILLEKVPDPHNSHIFQQMTHQINEPFMKTCSSFSEPNPTISLLIVVERQSQATDFDELTGRGFGDGSSQIDCQNDGDTSVSEERDRTRSRYEREEYSKMVDSDEDGHSSEEDQSMSGYEKHFMPTAVEILDV